MTKTVAAKRQGSLFDSEWVNGVYGGLTGALLMTLVMVAVPGLRATLFGAIPGLYGLAPPAAPLPGVVVHVIHGAIFGVGFVAARRALAYDPGDLAVNVALGVGFGLLVWLFGAAIAMPLWLDAVGFSAGPPFPNLRPAILPLHVLYGAGLGAVAGTLGGSR